MGELNRPRRPLLGTPKEALAWDRKHGVLKEQSANSIPNVYRAGWQGCIDAVAPAHRHVLANALAQAVTRGEVSLEVAQVSTATYGLFLEFERELKRVL